MISVLVHVLCSVIKQEISCWFKLCDTSYSTIVQVELETDIQVELDTHMCVGLGIVIP